MRTGTVDYGSWSNPAYVAGESLFTNPYNLEEFESARQSGNEPQNKNSRNIRSKNKWIWCLLAEQIITRMV